MQVLSLTVLAVLSCLAQADIVARGKKGCSDSKCYDRIVDSRYAAKDCKSYQLTTATPCPSTVTTYTTSTVSVTASPCSGGKRAIEYGRRDAALEARKVYPTKCTTTYSQNQQPPYANEFCKKDDYSSACVCLGYKPTTTTLPASTTTITKCAGTTTTTVPCPSSTTTTPEPSATACGEAQQNFCRSQTQATCFCQLDTDGVTPICTNGGICPQSTFPNPPPPCASDSDCKLLYPKSDYTRCVYDTGVFNCSPTFCATETECKQQY